MGKQVKGWTPPNEDEVVMSVSTDPAKKAWAPPADDVIIDPLKKKEDTKSDPVSESGTTTPGSGDSSQPVAQPGEPSGNPWQALGDGLAAANPLAKTIYDAGRRIISGFVDDAPKTASTLELKEAPRDFYDLFKPTKQTYKEAEDPELKPFIKEYNQWVVDNRDELTDGFLFKTPKFSREEEVKKFFQERHPEKLAPLEQKFNQKTFQRRLESEIEIQKQSKEAQEKTAGAVQDFRDIKSLTDLGSYIGTMGGQAAYQIPLAILTRGSSSLLQESATIYDQQLDNIARAKGISREEVIKQKLDDPAAGQAYAVLAAALDVASAGNIIKAFRTQGGSLIKRWARGAVPEAITEPTQGVLERQGAKTGAGTDAPAFDAAAMVNEAAGGLIGGSGGIFGGKTASEVIQEEAIKVDPNNPQSIQQAAETIQNKVNETTSNAGANAKSASESLSDVQLQAESSGVQGGAGESLPSAVRQKDQTQITDDAGTYDFSGVRQQLSPREEATAAADQLSPEATAGAEQTNVTYEEGNQRDEGRQEELLTSEQAGLKGTEQPAFSEVDQKSGDIVPRSEIQSQAVVTQNSGYPSQLFKDLEQISGDSNVALDMYKSIKDESGEFKQKHGNWENQIMRDYRQAGNEYSIKKGTVTDPDSYVSVTEGKAGPEIVFNENKVRREQDFSKVKNEYGSDVVAKENSQEYSNLYNQVVNKLRDLKLHLIHQELIRKQKGEVTVEDNIRSLQEIQRINEIPLAKDYYGEPMIFMHSGNKGITKFLKPGDKGYVQSDIMTGSAGIYFSRSKKGGKYYAEFGKNEEGKPAKGKDIYYVFLKTKNPYYMTDPRARADYKLESSETISKKDVEALKAKGYDSVIWDKENAPKHEVVVFEPDQVEIIGSYNEGLKKTDENANVKQSTEQLRPESEGSGDVSPLQEQNESPTQEPSSVQAEQPVPSPSQADSGSYVFRRPVQPPPPPADAPVGSGDGTGPPPTSEIPDQPSQPLSGERATIVKLQDESKLSDALKEGIEDFKEYETKKQSRSRDRAQKYINRVGEDQALQDAISFKLARTQEEKIALLAELADRFSTKFKNAEQEGNQEQVDQYYGKFMTAMNTLSNYITDTAQALSYLNLVGTVFETKTGALRFAKNQIEQSREGAMKNYQEMKMTAEELIKQFDALPMDEFLKSKQVQDLISKMKSESPKSQKARQADKKLKDAGDKLRELIRGTRQGVVYDPKSQAKDQLDITKALVDYVKALIQKLAIDAGAKIQDVRDQVVDGVKAFSQEIGLKINDFDVNDIVDTTITKNIEQSYRGDVRAALKEYVEKKSGLDELINKIVAAEGMTQKQASEFATRFNSIFQEYVQKEKERLVKRFTPKAKKPNKKRQEFYDKVIKLSNAGAVSDQQLDDTIASIFGLPAMTPEIANNIETMVEDINKAPEGRFKNIAITKLTDYIAKQQKFNITDYMLASFRAGIFSGIDTQALNLTGNFFNVLEMGFMLSLVNPKAAARFIGSVRNPTSLARAGLEALEILRTGFDPRVAGDAKRRVLEQRDRTLVGLTPGLKGWKQALDPQLEQQKKYVFRALSAGDILFSQGINDALQNELYARRASELGLKGSEAKAYVREKMGFTPEKIQAALNQANNEALAGQIPNDPRQVSLRAKEIIEQQRDPEIIEKAREYAQGQILTNTPTGYIGVIARGLNSMIQSLPVLSGLIPVVNFAANAMQRAVQYVPPAALARGAAHYISRAAQGENLSTIVKDDIQRLKSGDLEQEMRLRRFAAGTVSLAILAALLDDDDEDDNLLSKAVGKTVKIHGSGPGTKLNRQKTYQKQETGYLPYSIQIGDTYIPYKNYPGLNVLLSTFGEYQDAKRYGKLDKKDALNRLVFAITNSFAVISEMGFLTALNTTTQAFLEANPKEFTSLVTRPVAGLVFPKFQRNLVNFFDNQVYSGRDVQEIVIRSLPVLNTAQGDPLVNALGEPVERNWWDRVELWNTESYSAHKPIWEANAKNNYYIPVPSKGNLEETFERPISTAEYNQFFKLRGEEIAKNFQPEFIDLSPEEYKRKMDKIAEFGKYKALVSMGVMETDLMKEIRFQLDDIYEMKRKTQELRNEIKP